MRETKFRAKRKDGVWIYSDKCGLDLFFAQVLYEELEPQQYIGLKDRTKTDIYEGDILQRDGERAVVIWHKMGGYLLACWSKERKIKNPLTHKETKCRYFIGKEDEIIGNTLENPELLKETK